MLNEFLTFWIYSPNSQDIDDFLVIVKIGNERIISELSGCVPHTSQLTHVHLGEG